VKISVSVTDPSLVDWAEARAKREGTSMSAVVTEALRIARQMDARDRVLGWLGSAAELTPERESEIAAELGDGARPGKRRNKRHARR